MSPSLLATVKAWSHGAIPSSMVACPTLKGCPGSEEAWKQEVARVAREDPSIRAAVHDAPVDAIIDAKGLSEGFTLITGERYHLEPEAIESVKWGARPTYLDEYDATRSVPQAADLLHPCRMGATLKYFYLVFSVLRLASLDGFAFNSDGHPLRRVVG
ncbi:hypothetical protein C8A05DRAFT_34002 [Staphylotrichum tortipilum]|uniref:Uncharacterized protein n=1 Tax=Staphylotrichum tortipilum TaxID=2831512 RepID=A0AAN6RU94_9PEZI|nr:hypothetical protein C8A05DRAFT_34002 [Staphylotrichum longicolle]